MITQTNMYTNLYKYLPHLFSEARTSTDKIKIAE